MRPLTRFAIEITLELLAICIVLAVFAPRHERPLPSPLVVAEGVR